MAATESLQFSNDPISLLSSGLLAGSYSGTLSVDYTTGAVTGSITTSPALGSSLPILTYQNFTESFDAATGLYTLSSKDGILGLGLTTFSVSYSGTAPTTSTSSLALLGAVPVFGGTSDTVISTPIVCYVSGTLIRTVSGDTPVEALKLGDLVVTASGAHRPIKWLGHRLTCCSSRSRPRESWPIRIAAHAFGDNKPSQDLFVSPGHSICVDVLGEVLIPASSLINGSTVVQAEVASVTYWHVELDSHDILIANGLPAESYIEMGNRSFFAESRIVSLADGPDSTDATHADFCRPFHADGPLVAFVRHQLDARARALGRGLDEAPLQIEPANMRLVG